MASRTGTRIGWLAGLSVLAACSADQPEQLRASKTSEIIKKRAIPLERALAQHLVEVRPLATSSTPTELALSFKPLVRSQPWIRIDPGWVVQKPSISQAAFVTTQTIYARLPTRDDYEVRVRKVALRPIGSMSMPSNPDLVPVNDEKLVEFLRKTGDESTDPPWKILQIAVWAIVGNVAYGKVKPPTTGKHYGFRGNDQFATAGQIQEVAELLTKTGLDPESYAVWSEMNADLERIVAEYEASRDEDSVRAFMPFKEICNFYPMEVATDIMVSAFDLHSGADGREYRLYVVDALREHGTANLKEHRAAPELALLQNRATLEHDEKILVEMNRAIAAMQAQAAGPGR